MLLNHVFVATAVTFASAVNGQTWTAAFGATAATAALAGRDVATAATAASAALVGRDVATAATAASAALAGRDVATAATAASAALVGRDVATAASAALVDRDVATAATAASAALVGRDVATAATAATAALVGRDVVTAATAATAASAATAATVATQAAATTHAGNTTAAAAYVPLNPLGDIVAAQAPFGNSFLFYQSSTNGDIMMARVSNTFSDGSTSFAGAVVPGNEVLWGTPIAVAQQQEDGNDIGNLGLYFYSPNYTLSEYRYLGWRSPPWMGGPTCDSCVTTKNYKVQSGSRVLYAMGSSSSEAKAGIRVGFISENFPDTISEADRNYGTWRLAPLPN